MPPPSKRLLRKRYTRSSRPSQTPHPRETLIEIAQLLGIPWSELLAPVEAAEAKIARQRRLQLLIDRLSTEEEEILGILLQSLPTTMSEMRRAFVRRPTRR